MRSFTHFVLTLIAAALLLNAAERFDSLVRSDFFAGMAGDKAAMDRAMKLCEDTLAKDPKHPEALVWHGSGLIVNSGFAFRASDFQKGGELQARGLNEMAQAVGLAPENVAVLIPRGATLLTMASQLPDPAMAKQLTGQGLGDYEKVYEIQKPYFEKVSAHARGELLYGLASGYNRLGDRDRAKGRFEELLAIGKPSGHEAEAKEFVQTGAFTARPMRCTGCHTGN